MPERPQRHENARSKAPEHTRTNCMSSPFNQNANPSDDLLESAKLCQSFVPFRENLHRKWSATRPTKKMHLHDEFMKAECNKNDRLIFQVFAWCRLCSKATSLLFASTWPQVRTLSRFWLACAQKCKAFGIFSKAVPESSKPSGTKSEPFDGPRCASPLVVPEKTKNSNHQSVIEC